MSHFRADLNRIFKIEETHAVETNARKKNVKKNFTMMSHMEARLCVKRWSRGFFSRTRIHQQYFRWTIIQKDVKEEFSPSRFFKIGL